MAFNARLYFPIYDGIIRYNVVYIYLFFLVSFIFKEVSDINLDAE